VARNSNDDIIQKGFAGCMTVFGVFGFLFVLVTFPAAALGHLVHFTPSIGQIIGNNAADPNWQKPYPHMVLRIATVDLVLLTALLALLRFTRKRGSTRPPA
jgi:hypothetical protein